MKPTKTIPVWTDEETPRAKSALPMPAAALKGIAKVDSKTLADNLKDFLTAFDGVLADCPTTFSAFQIDEMELSLAVNAQGGIELLGKLSAGAEASIKVKLKRNDAHVPKS
jgi:hypothetical protein